MFREKRRDVKRLFFFICSVTLAAAILPIRPALALDCRVDKAPQIIVNPITNDIQYNFSLTSEQLSSIKTDTINPYASNVDTSTGGLRADAPRIQTHVGWKTLTDPNTNTVCFWYNTIKVDIVLSPYIYVSKDYKTQACRDAVLEHERKHVAVDREVINHYAQQVGLAVQQAVADAGALGPFKVEKQKSVQDMMVQHIDDAVNSKKLLLENEMRRRQAQVDTLQEYERVSKICNSAERNAGRYKR